MKIEYVRTITTELAHGLTVVEAEILRMPWVDGRPGCFEVAVTINHEEQSWPRWMLKTGYDEEHVEATHNLIEASRQAMGWVR